MVPGQGSEVSFAKATHEKPIRRERIPDLKRKWPTASRRRRLFRLQYSATPAYETSGSYTVVGYRRGKPGYFALRLPMGGIGHGHVEPVGGHPGQEAVNRVSVGHPQDHDATRLQPHLEVAQDGVRIRHVFQDVGAEHHVEGSLGQRRGV